MHIVDHLLCNGVVLLLCFETYYAYVSFLLSYLPCLFIIVYISIKSILKKWKVQNGEWLDAVEKKMVKNPSS